MLLAMESGTNPDLKFIPIRVKRCVNTFVPEKASLYLWTRPAVAPLSPSLSHTANVLTPRNSTTRQFLINSC